MITYAQAAIAEDDTAETPPVSDEDRLLEEGA